MANLTRDQGRTGSTLGPRAKVVVGAPHIVLGRGGAEVVGPRAVHGTQSDSEVGRLKHTHGRYI